MSSKGRGTVSQLHDFYRTPPFAVQRFLEAYPLPAGLWFEPCAGEGDIIKAVHAARNDVVWCTHELRNECDGELAALAEQRTYGDLLLQTVLPACHVYITNPPFTISLEIVEHLLKYGRFNHFIILQRLNWAAGPRRDLFRRLKPSTYVLPDRVSFTPDGKTDSTEYAWFVFDGRGEFRVLDDTPKEIRKKDREIMFAIVDYGLCIQCGEMITSANGSKLRTGDLLHLSCNKMLDAINGNIVVATTPRENENEQWFAENEDRIINASQGEANMAGLPKDMAEEVGKSSSTGGGNYIRHGNFIFMIKKWFYLLSPTKERCIIVELFVIDSVAKTVYHDQVAVNEVPNAIGSDCSEVANFDGKGKQSAPGNARAVVLGLFGLVEGSVAPELVQQTLEHVCQDNSPATGMLLRCSTFPKEKRQTPGEWITGRNWECVADPRDANGLNGAAAIAARMNAFKSNPAAAVGVARQQLGLTPVTVTVEAPAPQAAATPAINGAAPAANLFSTPPAAAPQLPPQGFTPPAPAGLPPLPAAAAPPPFAPPPASDPLAGWTAYPGQPGYFFKGQEVKSEKDLRASIQ